MNGMHDIVTRAVWGRAASWSVLVALAVLHAVAAVGAAPIDEPIDPDDAQPNWRWIGERVNTTAACPNRTNSGRTLPSWRIQPLFCTPLDPDDQDNGLCVSPQDDTIPPGLRPFCSYEYTLATPVRARDLTTLQQLVTDGKLKDIDPDSMAVAGFGSDLQDQTWQALANNFKREAGRPTTAPVGLIPNPLIRIAIVDTQPSIDVDADEAEHNAPHGNALANMADELLCDDATPTPNCAAIVAARLALGYVCPLDRDINAPTCRDPEKGGWIGTIGHLARAIRLETREWIDPQVSGHKLVLNLSVAWDARFGGLETNVSAMPAPVRAAYAAIADAQCRGALTFAAAGNLTGGPESQSGPMLPAAWEQRVAPKKPECQSRIAPTLPPNIFPPAGSDQRPFVYAVGGVRGDGLPLGNVRVDAEPRLVAFGDHADVQDESIPSPATPTPTLTGTSISTLVTSSAAALTWYVADALLSPGLKPFEVAEVLYNTGDKLGRSADFCRGGTPSVPCPGVAPEVTEVQACAAADSIAGTATCPTVTPLLFNVDDTDYLRVSLSQLTGTPISDPACGGLTTHYAGTAPENPCPFSQFFSELAEPWTAPQPPDSPCPNCGRGVRVALAGTEAAGSLFIEIDDARDWTLTDATLQCGDSLNVLPVDPLKSGDKVLVTLDDDTLCPPGRDMVLHFRDAAGKSTINPILDAD